MRKIYSLLLFILVSGACHKALAQEPNFSMYHYTPFLTNPGIIGVQEDVRLMLNYRNQSVDVGENFTTSMLSGFYPINVGNHRVVIAGTFLTDKGSEFLRTNGGLAGLSYSVNFAQGMELSLGVQGGFFQRRLDGDFTTDDQFINGGFDPNALSSEVPFNETRSYAILSSGLHWQWKDEQGRLKAFAGGSVFNFTEPDISFIESGDDDLPLSLKGNAGFRVYQGMKFSIMPTARWISQAGNSFVNVGSWFRYDLESTAEGTKQLGLGLWYHSNDAGVVSLEYNQPNFTLAASYDHPVSTEINTAQGRGIFELAIAFRLKKVEKKKKAIPETPVMINQEREIEDAESLQEEELAEKEPEKGEPEEIKPVEKEPEKEKPAEKQPKQPKETIVEESTESNQPALSDADRSILSETVRFKLDSYDLTDDSRVFLERVTGVLKRNEWLKVALIGHTCDLGPEKLNVDLSLKRAAKVRQYLLEKGIATSRFTINGEDEKRPLDNSGTEEARRKNRRVEFRIVK